MSKIKLYFNKNSLGQALQAWNSSCRLGIDFRAARRKFWDSIFYLSCLSSIQFIITQKIFLSKKKINT